MKPIPLSTIVDVTRAEVLGTLPDGEITEVSTDSRQGAPGSLFIGIKGERFDGGTFAAGALEKGAMAALVGSEWRDSQVSGPLLVVPDALEAMQRLAAWYRQQFSIPVAGITGSVGKTTISAMAFAAFQDVFTSVHKTWKNFNGQVGMPLSLFRLEQHHDAAVIEAGISIPGEMRRLTEMLRPTVALVANCGTAHLETMGSVEAIADEKMTLLEGLAPGGVAVLNADDPRTIARRDRAPGDVITYSTSGAGDLHLVGPVEENDDGLRFRTNLDPERVVFVRALGRFNVANALAALALVMGAGKDPRDAMEALAYFEQEDLRQQRIDLPQDISVLLDAYNAGPDSMLAAVEILVRLAGKRRSVAVLGDMYELGEDADSHHRSTAEAVARTGVDAVYFAGERAEAFSVGLAGFSGEQNFFPDTESLSQALPHLIEPGDFLLFKASRGMGLERACEALKASLEG